MRTSRSLAALLAIVAMAGCKEGGAMRNYCSDEPVCDKYTCEDGYGNSHCEKWVRHCRENPDDKDCRAAQPNNLTSANNM